MPVKQPSQSVEKFGKCGHSTVKNLTNGQHTKTRQHHNST